MDIQKEASDKFFEGGAITDNPYTYGYNNWYWWYEEFARLQHEFDDAMASDEGHSVASICAMIKNRTTTIEEAV